MKERPIIYKCENKQQLQKNNQVILNNPVTKTNIVQIIVGSKSSGSSYSK